MQYIEHERFLAARDKIVGKRHDDKGIGTLAEKSVHGVLKHFFEPNEDYHEVAMEGYFADIYGPNGVVEIQTRSFARLSDKLNVFLQYYPVTVVYPIAANTWVSKFNGTTGEVLSRRKSPQHLTVYDAFYELYNIRECLGHESLTVKLVFMDVEEYRLSTRSRKVGRKRTDKYDRIPLGITEIVTLECREDYVQFVPYELEEEFTVAEFAKEAHISCDKSSIVVNFLCKIDVLKRVGKRGRSYIYSVNE
ncbi:MAG: hypothetical protein IJB96_03800 [Lachnospira sp.]|nr:hypothetical protein [Lachnospira sp.]